MTDDPAAPAPDPFVERGVALAKEEMAKEPHRALPMMDDIVAAVRGVLVHLATWHGAPDTGGPPDTAAADDADGADHDTGDVAPASPPTTAW